MLKPSVALLRMSRIPVAKNGRLSVRSLQPAPGLPEMKLDVPILPASLASIQHIHRSALLVVLVVIPEALTERAVDRRVKVRYRLLEAVCLVPGLLAGGGGCKVVLSTAP